ncbi:MAG TPA: thiamine-phosphate kinase [Dehalococcoidia bacterium]|nr:thiamine-phosphate kinase [Dehalococcoidia bacterium]
MKVCELGEFGLIERLSEMIASQSRKPAFSDNRLLIGIGDDAAAWKSDSLIQLVTTDSLIEDIHFTLETATWEEIGWKSLAVNLSDIAGMGGLPRYALVSLGLPGDTEVDDITALYGGMIEISGEYEVAIIGGDTVSAPRVVINITVLGDNGSPDGPILTRSAALPGDVIAVTGTLGAAAGGFEMFRSDLSLGPEAAASLREACLRPHPRVTEGRILVENGIKAAMDISDGLVADLDHICRMSGVGARVEVDRVPVSSAVKECFPDRTLEFALSGGEDYELLFTAIPGNIDRVKAAASCPVNIIGDVIAGDIHKTILVDNTGSHVSLPGTGWDHFRTGRSQK